jgi:serine/threonine-protein kinase
MGDLGDGVHPSSRKSGKNPLTGSLGYTVSVRMAPENWQQIEELFHRALAQPPGERDAYLAAACSGDPDLYREVRSLLEAGGRADSFLDAAPVTRVADSSPRIGDRFGAYEIQAEISRGGMGAVYLASRADRQYEKRVAIKLVRPGAGGEDLVRRFLHERQILAGLEHHHIATLLDGGVTPDGWPYLVMEYIEGEPVDRYCEARRLAVEARLRLFLKICSAVHYAHQHLVVHRDLKPANILVTAEGEPKLLDFGIAKLLDRTRADQTVTGLAPMTPLYASPEQVQGQAVSTATDVYALGVLLYQLLAGRLPYHLGDSPTPVEIARAILEQTPEKPSVAAPALRRRLAGDLDNITLMALRKDPQRRYASVEQLAEDLRRHLAGWPVSARRDTVGYRTGKFVRRHKAGVSAAAAVMVALAGATVVSLRQAQVANRERAKAERVSLFVRTMLGSADASWNSPLPHGGPDVKVAEVLDRAAERMGTELRAEPEVEAVLRRTLGETYRALGLLEKARRELDAGLEKALAVHGEGHPETIRALHSAGAVRMFQGDFAAAEAYMRRALAAQRRSDPGALFAGQIENDLGVLLLQRGRGDEAEQLLRHSQGVLRAHAGPNDPQLAVSLGNLGLIHDNRGDLAGARRYYEEAIGGFRRLITRGSPPPMELAWSLLNLGGVYRTLGDFPRAEGLLREAVDVFQGRLGESHASVALPLADLALVRALRGEPDEGEKLARRALEIQGKALAPRHPDVARSLTLLGELLTHAGRAREAEGHLRLALDIRRELFPKGHRRIADTAGVLGYCLLRIGSREEAVPLLEEGHHGLRTAFGESHPRTATVRRWLDQARSK